MKKLFVSMLFAFVLILQFNGITNINNPLYKTIPVEKIYVVVSSSTCIRVKANPNSLCIFTPAVGKSFLLSSNIGIVSGFIYVKYALNSYGWILRNKVVLLYN